LAPDSPWSPWWRTTDKVAKDIASLAKLRSSDIIYDLGCGDARHLITFAKQYKIKCVGIEIDPLRYFIARQRVKRNKLDKRITIIKANFNTINISNATVVYVYLIPKVLRKIQPKLKRELKKGSKVISYRYKIAGLKLESYDKSNKLYFYKI